MTPLSPQVATLFERQWKPRYKGCDQLSIEPLHDGSIRVQVRIGRRWGESLLDEHQTHVAFALGENALLGLLDDAVRGAWLSAGGGHLDIPFRIRTRGPKRLRIRRDRGFEYPRVLA